MVVEILLNKIHYESNLVTLSKLPNNSIDSIVTDSPYGLSSKKLDYETILREWLDTGASEVTGKGFMGKKWDAFVPQPSFWKECFRVLKPGGYLLSFSSTRNQDLMAMSLRLAGFDIKDIIMWVYGNGFPKSLDISKAIDKEFGNEREVVGKYDSSKRDKNKESKESNSIFSTKVGEVNVTKPASKESEKWEGYGTALKPALEPITVAQKPLSESTYAKNVLKHSTGAMNIDACRVHSEDKVKGWDKPKGGIWNESEDNGAKLIEKGGRFPANFIHDGSEEVVDLFPVNKGAGNKHTDMKQHGGGNFGGGQMSADYVYDKGGNAARFFYCAKASKAERNEGLGKFEGKEINDGREKSIDNAFQRGKTSRKNIHPTVKPIKLMRYLIRLVTPIGGIVYDPFVGSGTTAIAATLEGFDFIASETEQGYVEIGNARLEYWKQTINPTLF